MNYLPVHLKLHLVKSNPLDEGHKRSSSNMRQVEAKDGMKAQKADKPLIVLLPHALPDPNAVVVVLGHTHLADRAVLGSGRFVEFACPAGVFLFVYFSIIVGLVFLDIIFMVFLGDFAW